MGDIIALCLVFATATVTALLWVARVAYVDARDDATHLRRELADAYNRISELTEARKVEATRIERPVVEVGRYRDRNHRQVIALTRLLLDSLESYERRGDVVRDKVRNDARSLIVALYDMEADR